MKFKTAIRFLAIGFMVFCAFVARAGESPKAYVIDVREEISPGMARKLGKALDEAQAQKVDLVILNMNTYGGLLDAADSMRTRLMNFPIPVVAFINNNAASAGALIAISCNRIYMTGGSSIGAATVVNESGEPLPDKYQSYMRSIMRSTAEKRGRDPLIAEAMVDPRTYIPGVNDSGKVLTFTTSEAIENGYCEKQAASIEEVLVAEQMVGAKQLRYEATWVDNVITFFTNPAVSGVLLLIILGGIYFELQTPGIGFPLLAAAVAAVLYFVPLYLDGMAANWEILLAIIGFALLAVEFFVIPGFGVAGISGILLIVVAFAFSMVGNQGFDFSPVSSRELTVAFATVVVSMFAAVVLAFVTGRSLMRSSRFGKMVLQNTMESEAGYVSADAVLDTLIGAHGVTDTLLRPSGKVLIGARVYDAVADNSFIEKGVSITVKSLSGQSLVVTKKTDL
ncbi:MAG: NfeD family protein [Bacteroidota bacterium]|jgi:membrane-bound serine protease (ClpP class)